MYQNCSLQQRRLTTTAADFVMEVHEFTIKPFSESHLSVAKGATRSSSRVVTSITFCKNARNRHTGKGMISVIEPPMMDAHKHIASGTKQNRP
jgi:hypothetical protein